MAYLTFQSCKKYDSKPSYVRLLAKSIITFNFKFQISQKTDLSLRHVVWVGDGKVVDSCEETALL